MEFSPRYRPSGGFWRWLGGFARFDSRCAPLDDKELTARIRAVTHTPPWRDALPAGKRVMFPGYPDLRAMSEARARIYGVRYVVSFTAFALALPLIAFVYGNYGFDTLFWLMSGAAALIFTAVACLPYRLPAPNAAPVAA